MIPVFTCCPCCGTRHEWSWEEAFDKFGFGDGDGLVMTGAVADALRARGYAVETNVCGLHNEVILSIKTRDGRELIPHERIRFGYDAPRNYLPQDIIVLLDDAFTEGQEVMP